MSGNSKKCPYESSRVECARCGSPYNVEGGGGIQPLDIESAKAMLYIATIPLRVNYYVIGGLCDACGYILGAVTKNNQESK